MRTDVFRESRVETSHPVSAPETAKSRVRAVWQKFFREPRAQETCPVGASEAAKLQLRKVRADILRKSCAQKTHDGSSCWADGARIPERSSTATVIKVRSFSGTAEELFAHSQTKYLFRNPLRTTVLF